MQHHGVDGDSRDGELRRPPTDDGGIGAHRRDGCLRRRARGLIGERGGAHRGVLGRVRGAERRGLRLPQRELARRAQTTPRLRRPPAPRQRDRQRAAPRPQSTSGDRARIAESSGLDACDLRPVQPKRAAQISASERRDCSAGPGV